MFREYDNILEESEEHTSEELTPELRGFNRWRIEFGIHNNANNKLRNVNTKLKNVIDTIKYDKNN